MTTSIYLDAVRKELHTLGNTHVAVDDLGLDIPEGSFTTFVGPSGCGKTTILRILAGLETPTSGTISLGDEGVTDLPSQERDVSIVFQSIALCPHMSVRESIDYDLKVHSVPEAERNERIGEAAEVLQVEAQLGKVSTELSGSQQQRVTLGGTSMQDPDVLLLDEPMSDLDAKLKSDLRVEIQRLRQELDTTVVYVTHDQTEAMTISNQVILLRDGELAQVDPPEQLFDYSDSEYVAQFIGMPSTSVVDCTVEHRDGETVLIGPRFELSLLAGVGAPTASRVRLDIRPQCLDIDSAGACRLPVDAGVIKMLGTESVICGHLEDDTPFDVVSGIVDGAVAGNRLDMSFDLAGAFVFGEDSETILSGSERTSEHSSSPAEAGNVTP